MTMTHQAWIKSDVRQQIVLEPLGYLPLMALARTFRYAPLIPNALTALRLCVAIAFPFSPSQWRLGMVLAGALSDALDGFFARRLHATTWVGAVLDGVTDKLFTLSVLLTLTVGGPLSWLQFSGLLARDVVNASIAAYVGAQGRWGLFRRVSARPSGKITTLALFSMMVAILWRPEIGAPLVWVAVAASIFAAADYAVTFVRWAVWKIEPAHFPPGSP